MTAAVMSYLGWGKDSLPKSKPVTGNNPTNESVRALPGQWYTSEEMYQLERRAIFSRRWLLMTHQNRIPEAGDFLRYTVADYDVIIIRGRDGKVNSFHNVCRHRAYPVIEQDEGKKSIIACRYHGWSYGLDGKLAKAPNYQELEGFDKSVNGLFPIHVHVDVNGFIWINMDGNRDAPEVPWEQEFHAADTQERFEEFNFDDYQLDHVYELDGKYNWKIACDNFNECYHCPTTHPDVPAFLNTESADVETKAGYMEHDHASSPEQKKKGFNVNSTYYFPNVSMSVSPHWMMIQKFLPTGPSASKMHYEIYRNKHASDENFTLISDMYARVMGEDKVLCERAQRNINAGVFVAGEMHPRCEKGPLYMQQAVREAIYEHFGKEKKRGEEIWPARQVIPGSDGVSQADLEICKGLKGGQKEELAW